MGPKSCLAACTMAAVLLAPTGASPQAPQPAPKVLRYAFEVAETSFDPAKIVDLYSRTLTPHIFEAPYKFDHLARPVKIKPLTAEGMPQHSDDYRVWTVRIRPGIYFADDPAFQGRKRELVAQDYAYAFKRFADPANRSPAWTELEEQKLVGLAGLRQQALEQHKPFDYDREIEGVRALDRYTLQFKVEEPRPRLATLLAGSDLYGAVAREVIEFYGADADAHPVGTGPFRLVQWRRSSFIVLERNPGFREMVYDAEPAPNDAEGQALAAHFRGRRLPMVDRVEVSIIEEEQPRWLSFVNGQADVAWNVGFQFVTLAMPNGKVAPNLAKLGIKGYQVAEPSSNYLYFNMEDPTVGGYTADRVALRRAIGLGMDARTEIAYAYNGQGAVSQQPLLPFTTGWDPDERTEFGDYDPARAKALLDVYGYVDRDGDGWRDMPDGTPLALQVASQPDGRTRRSDEVLKKNMNALGIRTTFTVSQWPENLKAARAGRLQIWSVGTIADSPDGQGALARYYSKAIGGENMARFRLPAFDTLYEKMQGLPDGPERAALFRQAKKLALVYMPYKFKLDRMATDMAQPWVVGYRRPVFWSEWWQYVDIDDSLRPKEPR